MANLLTWAEVEAAMDAVEDGDKAGVASVFWTFEGRTLDVRDGRGARQTVNIASFCAHFKLYRNTFRNWLRKYRYLIEPSAKETA